MIHEEKLRKAKETGEGIATKLHNTNLERIKKHYHTYFLNINTILKLN